METLQKVIEPKLEQETLKIQLSITTTESKKFVDELEILCKTFSVKRDYFFTFK